MLIVPDEIQDSMSEPRAKETHEDATKLEVAEVNEQVEIALQSMVGGNCFTVNGWIDHQQDNEIERKISSS